MTAQQRYRTQRLAVNGLPGVGTSTVAAALTATGRFSLVGCDANTGAGLEADVTVRVIAEAVKPEDRESIAGVAGPVLMVLTKADVCGLGPGGPLAAAQRRCTELAASAGVPVVPMVGLLAVAGLDSEVLDGELLAALRVLVSEPADLRTAATFVSEPHPVAAAVRQRLIETLEVFGVAHAVLAMRRPAATGSDVRATLCRVSGIDAVVAAIVAAGAPARYRRLLAETAELEGAAVRDAAVADRLSGDALVLTRMDAALEVMRAAGLAVDDEVEADGSALLARAVRWQRYGAGPVSALHGACAADITRGSLRLWDLAR
ncbi:MAG: hypothetical protein WBB07_21710 [Mycobacterium sp.]